LGTSEDSGDGYDYTVAWLDCLSNKNGLGRGIFIRGNHSSKKVANVEKATHKEVPFWKTFPFDAPSFLLSVPNLKAFNFIHFHKQRANLINTIMHYDPFFFPLDNIHHWNRMYGKRGFLQWQCVVPRTDNNSALKKIMRILMDSGLGVFLSVIKEFGSLPSEGILSFPMPGITLVFDFPNTGRKLFALLDRLDEIVVSYKGRIYPAKDARMSRKTFLSSFPEFDNFMSYIDPKFSSSFYRRAGGGDV